jgi:hypothetical protein
MLPEPEILCGWHHKWLCTPHIWFSLQTHGSFRGAED